MSNMPSVPSVLTALFEVRPDLAHKVQVAGKGQLHLFHEPPPQAPKDHVWEFETLEFLDGETSARFHCKRCGTTMYRSHQSGRSRVHYLDPAGCKTRVRPPCVEHEAGQTRDLQPRRKKLSKADYVRTEASKGHDGKHSCHARGCGERVPPAYVMCARHWRMVPPAQQRNIWEHFRPGQEKDKQPTRDYLKALRAAVDAVAKSEAEQTPGAQ